LARSRRVSVREWPLDDHSALAPPAAFSRDPKNVGVVDLCLVGQHVGIGDGSHGEVGRPDVLTDPRLRVHINDGRQHLQMQPAGAYDLITLEPPPIAYAGVGALYSREFYALARSRLKPGGYISQWLPAYQVPTMTTLAMIRAFVEVFPQAVLLSGAESDLILIGTTAERIEIDPDRLAAALARAPAVRMDLERVDLGEPHELIVTFVGSARTPWPRRRAASSR